MKKTEFIFIYIIVSTFISICGCAQYIKPQDSQLVGGPCEGCEAVFEYGNQFINAVDTLPDFNDEGQKIKLTGTIYEPDGNTPAEGVILYIYHTNREGIYAAAEEDTGWGQRHGYIRGWIKTGQDGKYTFFTLKPGRYPNRTIPAHIHPVILEPNGKYYWVGSYHFGGDPYLTEKETSPDSPRCGSSGLLILKKDGDLYVGIRDFVLGKNIPDYQ